jgi:hypothetical protein
LHITRGKHWTDSDASPIAQSDWERLVGSDPDLEMTGVAEADTPDGTLRYENRGLAVWRRHPSGENVWFDFRQGRVVVKNPDEATIEKMLAVARELGARVVGDDGEAYHAPKQPPTRAKPSLSARLWGWFQRLWPTKPPSIPLPPFAVGARVRDAVGSEGVVLAIDPREMHGFGSITVRFDDGRELTFAMFAHGLVAVEHGRGQ